MWYLVDKARARVAKPVQIRGINDKLGGFAAYYCESFVKLYTIIMPIFQLTAPVPASTMSPTGSLVDTHAQSPYATSTQSPSDAYHCKNAMV